MPLPNYTDVTGLAGIAIALTWPLLALPGIRQLGRSRRAVLTGAAAILFLIPFGPLSLAAGVRGFTGDLSITTLVLVVGALLRSVAGWPPVARETRFALLAIVAVAAVALYPMALGFGLFDPYRSGYGSPWLLGALGAIALAAWLRRHDLIAICIALATLGWSVRWYESNNLWDYLLDPPVSFYALGYLAVDGVKRMLTAASKSGEKPPAQIRGM